MKLAPLELDGVWIARSEPFEDERGRFSRLWCNAVFEHAGAKPLRQISEARSITRGTLRGLHYQRKPHWEQKTIRCMAGAAFVVCVDLRPGSSTYRKHTGLVLSAEESTTLFVDEGFAQGYQTLADDTLLLYAMSADYQPGSATGVRFDDPALRIEWPLPPVAVSERDSNWPLLDER
ncbi:MAG TPA: dTDP-4-dehydrorhamnose 3,5-epimerase [Planctomycetaceae bacterium]|nr:dTDP-4-dehydrorhamnose 3,5-epimerase [Planctomycetaceae bacterium]